MNEQNHRARNIVLVFLLLLLAGTALFFAQHGVSTGGAPSVDAMADQVMKICKESPNRKECYDREIPALMDTVIMEQAFAVTELVLERDPSYAYCHLLGHKLSGIETRKDLNNWKNVITRCPTGICNYGCLHGPLLERFAKQHLNEEELERVKPELKAVCRPREGWDPAPLERSMCYHGMGHLHMYLTRANIMQSVDLCRYLASEGDAGFLPVCLEGVFMQVFQPLEPEDEALVRAIAPTTKEAAVDFCSKFEGMEREYCWRESWPFYRKEIHTPEGMTAFCASPISREGRESCRIAVVNIVTTTWAIEENNVDKLYRFCRALPKEFSSECFVIAASRMLQTNTSYVDRAVEICAGADGEAREQCHRHLAAMAKKLFRPGTDEFHAYCDRLSVPVRNTCARSGAGNIP